MVGVSVGFVSGTGLCLSQMLIAPLSWIGPISTFYPIDEELAQPTPPSLAPHPRASSFSQPSLSHDYPDLHATLRSTQEEQAFLRACIETEYASLQGFVQKHHDELCGIIASQNEYFQDFWACLETWRD